MNLASQLQLSRHVSHTPSCLGASLALIRFDTPPAPSLGKKTDPHDSPARGASSPSEQLFPTGTYGDDRHRHAQPAAHTGGGEAVRVAEVRVQYVQSTGTPQRPQARPGAQRRAARRLLQAGVAVSDWRLSDRVPRIRRAGRIARLIRASPLTPWQRSARNCSGPTPSACSRWKAAPR